MCEKLIIDAVEWRLLKTGFNPAAYNMGVDEAVMESVSSGASPPAVRFYGWSPPAVSIGYFQSLTEEVDLDECGRKTVDVVRRITGGGAVYHDKELTYSLIAPEKFFPKDVLESYRKICAGIVSGLRDLGVRAEFTPLNDITVSGRKISGNAQTRRKGVLLQHGTILLEVDVDLMFSLLKVPSEKLRGKLIADVKERVTSLKNILCGDTPPEELAEKIARGFEKELNVRLVEGFLNRSELESAEKRAREKYSKEDWNNKR